MYEAFVYGEPNNTVIAYATGTHTGDVFSVSFPNIPNGDYLLMWYLDQDGSGDCNFGGNSAFDHIFVTGVTVAGADVSDGLFDLADVWKSCDPP